MYKVKKELIFTMIVALFVLFAMAFWGSNRVQARGPEIQGQFMPAAVSGTAFTYQGKLLWNGRAVDGQLCSIIFSLWNAETGGQQIGSSINTVVRPQKGYFTVQLDFGSSAFDGSIRWLQMQPSCEASMGPVMPRVPLTPAPVAHSLRPGAMVIDTTGSTGGLYAQSGPDWLLPLFVMIKTPGLWGDSKFGDGVVGTSQQGNGLYGYSESGKALYADGDAHVEGNLTWKAKTSAISVSPAAFVPNYSDQVYRNAGSFLLNLGSTKRWWSANIQLPHGATIKKVQFCWQDGSDEQADGALMRRPINTPPFSGAVEEVVASVSSRGSVNTIIEGCAETNNIHFPTVDNINYAYYLDLNLPPDGSQTTMVFYGVRVIYEIKSPY